MHTSEAEAEVKALLCAQTIKQNIQRRSDISFWKIETALLNSHSNIPKTTCENIQRND